MATSNRKPYLTPRMLEALAKIILEDRQALETFLKRPIIDVATVDKEALKKSIEEDRQALEAFFEELAGIDSPGAQGTEKKPHWISSTLTSIAQHPTVPHILSFYAQLIFNVFLLAGCAYLIYCFWSAVGLQDSDRIRQSTIKGKLWTAITAVLRIIWPSAQTKRD